MTAIGMGIGIPFNQQGFSPFAVGQPIVLLDAALGITLNGADVSNWADQSGDGVDVLQATVADQPLYNSSDSDFNNQPSVEGDGVTEHMQSSASAFIVTQPFTVILAYKAEALATNNIILDTRTAGGNNISLWANVANEILMFAGTSQNIGTLDLNPHIRALVFDGANSKSWEDGVADHPAASPGAFAPVDIRILSNAGGSAFGNSKIPEIIIYNKELTTAELNYIGVGLSSRYGTTWTSI